MDLTPDFDLVHAIRGVSHDKQWDILKPELESLFHAKHSYAKIARHMKDKYGFDAQVPSYKYHFNRKWGWEKNVSALKKNETLETMMLQALNGTKRNSPSEMMACDRRKLKRHVAATLQDDKVMPTFNYTLGLQSDALGQFLPFGVRPFSIWNVPVGGALMPPPSANDVEIDMLLGRMTKPTSSTSSSTVPQRVSPHLTNAFLPRSRHFLAKLFQQGRLDDLMQTLSNHQARVMFNWLYQYWLCAYKKSKHWPATISESNPNDHETSYNRARTARLPNWGHSFLSSPPIGFSGGILSRPQVLKSPSNLCYWSIHTDFDYTSDEEKDEEELGSPLEQILKDNLKQNEFNAFAPDDVPIDVSQIAAAFSNSPQVLLEETLSFAIMSQNFQALYDIYDRHPKGNVQQALISIHAKHIATSYLDGGKQCCNVLDFVCWAQTQELPGLTFDERKKSCLNDHGHTVLDNLMLTILRSHTKTPLERVDSSLKHGARYPGFEVDICGRWDADSSCVRSSIAANHFSIPADWKHKFCHTSAQAICHCISTLDFYFSSEMKGQPSGLFESLCECCGKRLQLQPLHALVMVAYELVSTGCHDEDLFGIIACYLCMLSCGLDPLYEADVSVAALVSSHESTGKCDHRTMTPYELVQHLEKWVDNCRSGSTTLASGWKLLYLVCKRAQHGHARYRGPPDSPSCAGVGAATFHETCEGQVLQQLTILDSMDDSYPTKHSRYCPYKLNGIRPFGMDPILGHLWACVQAEMLSYRRTYERDSWHSKQFDFAEVAVTLEDERDVPNFGYKHPDVLQPYCSCGYFGEAPIATCDEVFLCVDPTTKIWMSDRASIILRP